MSKLSSRHRFRCLPVPLVTVAWYMTFWDKHSPFRGTDLVSWAVAFFFFGVLREFSFLLFSPSITTATLGMQLCDSFTVFLLMTLWRLLDGGKRRWMILRNYFPTFVLTLSLYGGLYQIIFLFLFRLLDAACGCA